MKVNSSSLKNIHISSEALLVTPRELQEEIPQTTRTMQTVSDGRDTIERILDGDDHRLLAIVGPCSIHNLDCALEYAQRLKALAVDISDTIFVVMRAYFEKPRSSLGWKGLIDDPFMDGSFNYGEGLRMARKLLRDVAELGLPAGTELLDTLVPQYIGDFISWSAVGARTTEAQTHRAVASGSSSPAGFKNGTDGAMEPAVNAVCAALSPQRFLGFTEDGLPAVFGTTGNPHPHIVLRGGKIPNYDAESVEACLSELRKQSLPESILIDCSHANSGKNPKMQETVLDSVLTQVEDGNKAIKGFMLESYLKEGNQQISENIDPQVSVTDACIGWDETKTLLLDAHAKLSRLKKQTV